MADEEKKKDQSGSGEDFNFPSDDFKTDGGESPGLGNLPPLSDFESEPSNRGEGGLGGLPPLSDLEEAEPQPTGGRIKPHHSDFRPESALDTPTPPSFDTPSSGVRGSGFQNLAADSDFSPETPEIGPGPDSDIETPMFDSAFGGQDSGFNTPSAGFGVPPTGAPTQAMETPMFGDSPSGGGLGFDDDAFGLGARNTPSGGNFGIGGPTPAPDFGADTQIAMPAGSGPPVKRGGVSPAVAAAVLIVGAIGGIIGGQFLKLPFFPDVQQAEIDRLTQDNRSLQSQVDTIKLDVTGSGQGGLSQDEIDRLIQEKDRLSGEIVELQQQHATAEQATVEAEGKLAIVSTDLEQTTAEYADTRREYEQLLDEVAIISARQEGLLAETERLTGLVGQLEEADQRRIASKDALAHGIERLQVSIKEGIPLTPERFSREGRMARVGALSSQVAGSNWVAPDMVREFTTLFLAELEVAESREYFFAKIPVEDRYGSREMKWAECLMNGNWSVYYRTLDGRNIGVYENVGTAETAEYAFVQFLPSAVEKSIETHIVNARTPGWENQVRLLAEKQEITGVSQTEWQQWFSSL